VEAHCAVWEGFDEGFHYGYVQLLSTTGRFPVLGRDTLSREIWRAYELAPVSHYLQPFTKAPVNFGDYFALTQEERLAIGCCPVLRSTRAFFGCDCYVRWPQC